MTEPSDPFIDETQFRDAAMLATCKPLRGLPGIWVAPQIPDAVLDRVALMGLVLEPDEQLVAVLDRTKQTPHPVCVLTTRRLLWVEALGKRAQSDGISGPSLPVIKSAPLADLHGAAAVRGKFVHELDLGAYGTLKSPHSLSTLSAVADVFVTVASVSDSPLETDELTPEAVAWTQTARHNLQQTTERLKAVSGRVSSFRAEVRDATPRVIVTPILAAACVVVFLLMALRGVPLGGGNVIELAQWGACSGSSLAHDSQWWRLLTHQFVHAGLIHMAFNVWCLISLGPVVERLFGSLAFLAIFLISGAAGGLACAATTPNTFVVGASGAIFGIGGALLAFLAVHRHAIPRSVLERLRNSTLSFIGLNLILGFTMPNVANAAHVGGLAAGLLAGLLLQRAWPPAPSSSETTRRCVAAAAMIAALGLGGDFLAGRLRDDPATRKGSIDALNQAQAFKAYLRSLRTPLEDYEQTGRELQSILEESKQGQVTDESLHPRLSKNLERLQSNASRLKALTPTSEELKPLHQNLMGFVHEQVWLTDSLTRLSLDPDVMSQTEIDAHVKARNTFKQTFMDQRDTLAQRLGLSFKRSTSQNQQPVDLPGRAR